MDKRTILSGVVLLSTSALLFAHQQHRKLSHRVRHQSRHGVLQTKDDSSDNTLNNAALPDDLVRHREAFFTIDDEASLAVPTSSLRSTSQPLLTTYLRFTMSQFHRFPQAYIMKLIFRSQPGASQSFDPAYIQTLDFVPGDVVNGGYRLITRSQDQAVFAMAMPAGFPQIDGRLIVGLREEEGQTVFYSRTLQWKRGDNRDTVLPLERRLTRWLHEYASWWLLVAGTDYLCKGV